jgi:hypothetical protein
MAKYRIASDPVFHFEGRVVAQRDSFAALFGFKPALEVGMIGVEYREPDEDGDICLAFADGDEINYEALAPSCLEVVED